MGKTSTAKRLAHKLDALYVNLTELATKKDFILRKDEKRNTLIIDEKRMTREIGKVIQKTEKNAIVADGHCAADVVPAHLATHVFVLRRDPVELKKLMEKAGFSDNKMWENLAAEILDVCLIDAINVYGKEKICEVVVTGKTVEENINELLNVLRGKRKPRVGVVDWLGKLESEGVLDSYLKV
ncbi:AAA family ATPase [Candidatus Bathyarchaeota archaeon]|nr:AAA family ATPase [Candidatus Bathyarchaeota archaeon]